MSREAKLEPVTNHGPVISVPEGEIMIGRGPYLGVVDSRVSRNHANLKVDSDGSVSIKPVHKNPTFYKEFGGTDNRFVPLIHEQWKILSNNDEISLLPNALIYRIVLPAECTLPLDDDDDDDTDIDDNMSCLHKQANNNKTSNNENDKEDLSDNEKEQDTELAAALSEDDGPLYAEPLQKARVLPDWLQQLTPSQSPTTTTGKGKGKGKGKKAPVPKVQPDKPSETTEISSPTINANIERMNLKRNRNDQNSASGSESADSPYKKLHVAEMAAFNTSDSIISDDDFIVSDDDVSLLNKNKLPATSTPLQQAPAPQQNTELSPSDNKDETEKGAGDQSTSMNPKQNHSNESDDDDDDEDGNVVSSVSKAATAERKPCAYAATCYRRNPSHFQQFSHPGDADYEVEKTDKSEDDNYDYDNDSRPECPYGPECYRENKQHKLSYKHAKRPRRKAAQKARKKTAGKSVLADDEGENNYDFDDSFIDDDSDESIEPSDSDYNPREDYSKDTDDEDIPTLIKEANKFKKTIQ